MKKVLYKASLHPLVRIAVFFLLLGLGWTVWSTVNSPDWGAERLPSVALPEEMRRNMEFSSSGNELAGCSEGTFLSVLPVEQLRLGAPRFLNLPTEAQCMPFTWSPDSKTLLMPYVTQGTDQPAPGLLLISTDGKTPARVIRMKEKAEPTFRPVWSPDGRTIAYLAGERNAEMGGIWIMDLPSGKRKQLLPAVIAEIAFDGSGKNLYALQDVKAVNETYNEDLDDYPHLWRLISIPLDGGAIKTLAEWTQGRAAPSDSILMVQREGGVRYLRYVASKKGNRYEIWEGAVNGTAQKKLELIAEPGVRYGNFRWSQGGDQLAYIETPSPNDPELLRIVDVESGQSRRFIEGSGVPVKQPLKGDTLGRAWSDLALSPSGDRMTATMNLLVEGFFTDKDLGHEDHIHDDKRERSIATETTQSLMLKLQ